MFSTNQLIKARSLIVRESKEKNTWDVYGGSKPHNVHIHKKKISCSDCWHFANRTAPDIIKYKDAKDWFFRIHWCSHILGVFYETNHMGFRNLVNRELIKEQEEKVIKNDNRPRKKTIAVV